MKKSVVLLSSGLDSTVNLYAALKQSRVVLALTFDYGQRARHKEIECAQKICKELGVNHKIVSLPFFTDWGTSSLTDHKKSLPLGNEIKIDDLKTSQDTAKSVWVPNRNGVFLNIAAGFAESLSADWIVPGFNKEEATTFADNSDVFLQQASKSFSYSTANSVEAVCFTIQMTKSEIVEFGLKLNVNFKNIWPCYQDLPTWCGECESCLRSKRAFESAGILWKDLV